MEEGGGTRGEGAAGLVRQRAPGSWVARGTGDNVWKRVVGNWVYEQTETSGHAEARKRSRPQSGRGEDTELATLAPAMSGTVVGDVGMDGLTARGLKRDGRRGRRNGRRSCRFSPSAGAGQLGGSGHRR